VVLLDTCPVLATADARILSQHVDGAVMVVREGHCQRDDVVDALACLGAAGGKLLGTIYVGTRWGSSRRLRGYGRYYGNYYGSYQDTTDRTAGEATSRV